MNNSVLNDYILDDVIDDGDHLDWSWVLSSDIECEEVLEDEDDGNDDE